MMLSPMKCSPCYKDYLWGGTKLKAEYGKQDAPFRTAESWELAAHDDGMSRIAEGVYAGMTLDELAMRDRSAVLGERFAGAAQFPILVKLIDAKRDLSVQVHPSERDADPERGEQGKTEAWYVADCEPNACIYFGFSETMNRDSFLSAAKAGTIKRYINCVPVKKGDVFLIPPGTIHAIGAGVTIVEVQQCSNTTFRIYDYGRTDENGNARPLHLLRAADVLRYQAVIPSRFRSNIHVVFPEFELREVVTCPHFRLFRIDVFRELTQCCDGSAFRHLLCIGGSCELLWNGEIYPISKGDSYFLPASIGEYKLRGECRLLLTTL